MTEDEVALEELFCEELIALGDIEEMANKEGERLSKIKKKPTDLRRAANKVLKRKLDAVETVSEAVDKV